MTVLDWVLVVVWAGITLAGFFKGAIRIVFGVGGFALGIWLAAVVGPDLAPVVSEVVPQAFVAVAIAYLLPWLAVTVLCAVAGWGMERTTEALKLGCLNRLAGAVIAGAAAAAVLALLLLTAVRLAPPLATVERRSLVLDRVEEILGAPVAPDDAESGSDEPDPVGGDGGGGSGTADETKPAT